MSHSKRNQLSSDRNSADVSQMGSLPVDVSAYPLSRSTSPSSTRTSSASISPPISETHQDTRRSSTSRSTLGINHYASSLMRQVSNDSCEENPCSRCRLSEEEHQRIKAERRKEQNRASQRRFRAKKENEIRGAADQVSSLESVIQDLQKRSAELSQTNLALMARIAELENQHSYNFPSREHSGNTTQCQNCHKLIPADPPTDVIDYFWPVDNAENQHLGQLGPYVPLFDHELMAFEA